MSTVEVGGGQTARTEGWGFLARDPPVQALVVWLLPTAMCYNWSRTDVRKPLL